MVAVIITSIYILMFEYFSLDLRAYILGLVFIMAIYRAKQDLNTSLLNFIDFYPITITRNRIIEFGCSLIYILYFYIETDAVFDLTYLITLMTFTVFFYYYLFRGTSD